MFLRNGKDGVMTLGTQSNSEIVVMPIRDVNSGDGIITLNVTNKDYLLSREKFQYASFASAFLLKKKNSFQ